MLGQALAELERLHAGRDRQNTDGDRPGNVGSPVYGLEAFDDLAREHDGHRRTGREQLGELGSSELRQHGIADRNHRGRARLLRVHAHLADDLPPRHLADHVFPLSSLT
jgi:hypothetical protein